MKNKKILIYPDKDYPCNHSFIEEVLAKRLGEKFKVYFLFEGTSTPIKWHKSIAMFYKLNILEKILFKKIKYPPVFSIVFNLFFYLNKVKPDYIFVRNKFYWLLFSLILKKKQKIIYQKSFPNEKFIIHRLKTRNDIISKLRIILNKIKYNILVKLINRTDLLLPITKKYLTNLYKDGLDKNLNTFPFPLGFDDNFSIDKNKIKKIKNKYNLNSYKVFIYIGAIDLERKIDFILKSFDKFNDIIKSKLIILARDYGNNFNKLKSEIIKKGLNNIILKKNITREEVYHFIKASDYGLLPIPMIDIYKISSPTKVVECIALNRPVITTNIPDCSYLINKTQMGTLTKFNINCLVKNMKKITKINYINKKDINKDLMNIRGYDIMVKDLINYFNKNL